MTSVIHCSVEGEREREREDKCNEVKIIIIYEDQYSRITAKFHTQASVCITSTYKTAVSNMQSHECVVKILV